MRTLDLKARFAVENDGTFPKITNSLPLKIGQVLNESSSKQQFHGLCDYVTMLVSGRVRLLLNLAFMIENSNILE